MGRHTVPAKGGIKQKISFIIISDRPFGPVNAYASTPNIPIGPSTLLLHQIEQIKQFRGDAEIITVVGEDRENVIRDYGHLVKIIENPLYACEGESEAVRLAVNNTVNSNIVLCMGNTLFSADDLRELCVKSSVSVSNQKGKGVGVIHQFDKLLSFAFRTKNEWTGLIYLNDAMSDKVRETINHIGKNLKMYEVISGVIEMGLEVKELKAKSIRRVDDLC